MKRILKQPFIALFVVLLFRQALCWGVDGSVSVNMNSPSLFSGSKEPGHDFDYTGWAGNRKLYKNAFNEELWDKAAPVPKLPSGGKRLILSRADAENLLLRYQKPGGFTAKRDSEILATIVASDLTRQEPYLVAGALQIALADSPALYDRLISSNPKLRKIQFAKFETNPFRTKGEEKQATQAAVQYAAAQMERLLPASDPLAETELKDWTNLRPLATTLQHAENSDASEDAIMESIVFKAQKGPFKKNFASLLFTVIEPAVEPLFGDEPEVVTHLEMAREGATITPTLYGTQPLDGLATKRNRYGFYSAELAPIDVTGDLPKEPLKYKWSMNGRPFEAKVSLMKTKEHTAIVPAESSPPYDEMLYRKKLNALVLFGSNIKADVSGNLKQYLRFLKQRGFVEDGAAEKKHGLKDWVRDQIVSGETAIIDKEAHAHGDLSNIIEVDQDSMLLTLKRKSKDGPDEVVRIAYPYLDKSRTARITIKELGEWVRKRKRETGKPLVVANESCWSIDTAKNIIPEVHDKALILIVGTTMLEEFVDRRDDGARIVLDGFLKRKSFPEIRQDLTKYDEGYRTRTSDRFIFPDEKEYIDLVFEHEHPVRVRIQTTDLTTGRHYEAEDLSEGCWNAFKGVLGK